MRITLRIERFDPKVDEQPAVREYTVAAEPTDRVLSLLEQVKTEQDSTLAFRRSCAHGVCGSDAMVINGQERLACKTLVQDVAQQEGDVITITPLRSIPVQQDLMVDQTQFFANYRAVKPFFISGGAPPDKEFVQSPQERRKFDDATNCILCASCYSACPILNEGKNPQFVGPAAIVQAARFNDDSRDQGFAQRLEVLDEPNGAWPCENHFQCTRVCPRSIKITKLINFTKRRIKKHKGGK